MTSRLVTLLVCFHQHGRTFKIKVKHKMKQGEDVLQRQLDVVMIQCQMLYSLEERKADAKPLWLLNDIAILKIVIVISHWWNVRSWHFVGKTSICFTTVFFLKKGIESNKVIDNNSLTVLIRFFPNSNLFTTRKKSFFKSSLAFLSHSFQFSFG